ncbi:MAG: hypothetical protein HT579_03605 [Candidatus Accumulibacter similis]|nr:MAG: hypothetical protein HT579_03605 [Candidatus Accumulibacter similis]
MRRQGLRGRVITALLLAQSFTTPAWSATVNYRASGSIPLTVSANDFHVRIAIPEPAAVGDPIDFSNGPWGSDGVVTHSGASFTVDWSGPLVTSGGPYDFAFEFTSDRIPVVPVPEAWWTLDSRQVGPNFGNLFALQEVTREVPEPLPLALLAIPVLMILRRHGRS